MAELWVFGYGSLMWQPGFDFAESAPAVLRGAHRALCVYSVVHRGTRRRPGLVMGLDVGGSCRGIAFRIPAGLERETLAYLRAREQVTMVYREVLRPVRLTDGSRRDVRAVCYLADRLHPQYAGPLPITLQARLVQRGQGRSGDNLEYVVNTIRHLQEMGIEERALARLASLLGVSRSAITPHSVRRIVSADRNDQKVPS